MNVDLRHACKKQIIVEFDEAKGIIHFTSLDKLYINTPSKLACINEKLTTSLEKYAKYNNIFMVIDLNAFLIELDFAKHIFPFLENICKNYLHPDGIIAYGHSVTRLAFKMNARKLPGNHDHYFGTKEEAFAHIDNHLIENNFDLMKESLKTTPIKIDTIDVIPAADAPDSQKV